MKFTSFATSFAKTMAVVLGLGMTLQSATSLADFGRPGAGPGQQQGGQQFGGDRGGPGDFDRGGPGDFGRGGLGDFGRGGPGDFGRGGPGDFGRGPRPMPPMGYGIDAYRASQITQALYRAILFRNVDPSGMQSNTWTISQGGYEGVRQAARGLVDSPEFQQNIWPRFNAPQIAVNLYQGLLGRQPDPGGFRNSVDQLQYGNIEGVVDGMVTSPEFRQRFGF